MTNITTYGAISRQLDNEVKQHKPVHEIWTAFEKYYSDVKMPPIEIYQLDLIGSSLKHGHDELADFVLNKSDSKIFAWPYPGVKPSPLLISIMEKKLHFAERLLKIGDKIDQNGSTKSGDQEQSHIISPLNLAIDTNDLEALKLLFEYRHIDLSARDILLIACERGALKSVKFLMEEIKDPTFFKNPFLMKVNTPLMKAARNGPEIVKYLLGLEDFEPDWTATDYNERTCLHWAVMEAFNRQTIHPNQDQVLEIFLSSGQFDVNAKEKGGKSAVDFLAHHLSQFKFYGIRNPTDAFHALKSLHNSLINCYKLLLRHGAEVNALTLTTRVGELNKYLTFTFMDVMSRVTSKLELYHELMRHFLEHGADMEKCLEPAFAGVLIAASDSNILLRFPDEAMWEPALKHAYDIILLLLVHGAEFQEFRSSMVFTLQHYARNHKKHSIYGQIVELLYLLRPSYIAACLREVGDALAIDLARYKPTLTLKDRCRVAVSMALGHKLIKVRQIALPLPLKQYLTLDLA